MVYEEEYKEIGVKTIKGNELIVYDFSELDNVEFITNKNEQNIKLKLEVESLKKDNQDYYNVYMRVRDTKRKVVYTIDYCNIKNIKNDIEDFLWFLKDKFDINVVIKQEFKKKVIFIETGVMDILSFEINNLSEFKIIKSSFECNSTGLDRRIDLDYIDTLSDNDEIVKEYYGEQNYYIIINNI